MQGVRVWGLRDCRLGILVLSLDGCITMHRIRVQAGGSGSVVSIGIVWCFIYWQSHTDFCSARSIVVLVAIVSNFVSPTTYTANI